MILEADNNWEKCGFWCFQGLVGVWRKMVLRGRRIEFF